MSKQRYEIGATRQQDTGMVVDKRVAVAYAIRRAMDPVQAPGPVRYLCIKCKKPRETPEQKICIQCRDGIPL